MVINRLNKMTVKTIPDEPTSKQSFQIHLLVNAVHAMAPQYESASMGSGSRSSEGGGGGRSPHPNDLGDGGGDQDQLRIPSKVSKCSKRMCFILFFVMHGTFCFLAAAATGSLWCHIHFSKMKYFVSSNSAPFLNVETGSTWRVIKFITGSLTHVVLAWWTLIMLVGTKWQRDTIARYKHRVILCISLLALLAEFIMFHASLDYIVSQPVIQNGVFLEAVRPPPPRDEVTKSCFNQTYLRTPNPGEAYIRLNLKMMTKVLCRHEEGSHHPMWGHFLEQSWIQGQTSVDCETQISALTTAAHEDCHNAFLLQMACYCWLAISFLGAIFSGALLYMQATVEVDTKPNIQFTFDTVQDLPRTPEVDEIPLKRNTHHRQHKSQDQDQDQPSSSSAFLRPPSSI